MFSYAYIQGMRKLAEEQYTQYAIQKGDTFGGIGKANKVSPQRMQAANPGVDPGKLQLGQKINIPVSDRQNIIDTKGFDPEVVADFDPATYWRGVMYESGIGKWQRPIGNPAGNTAFGYHMMTRPAWDDVAKRYPDEFKGRSHSELASDFNLSHLAYSRRVQDAVRRWQYSNGVQVPATDFGRFWYAPNNPYGAAAYKYHNALNSISIKSIHDRIKALGGVSALTGTK